MPNDNKISFSEKELLLILSLLENSEINILHHHLKSIDEPFDVVELEQLKEKIKKFIEAGNR